MSVRTGEGKFCLNYITTYEDHHTRFEMEPNLPNDINLQKNWGGGGGRIGIPSTYYLYCVVVMMTRKNYMSLIWVTLTTHSLTFSNLRCCHVDS